MSLKIGAFNSNYRCECPNINEGFVFFGWRILFSDLAVLQNAALLSCPRGAGSVASRFENGDMTSQELSIEQERLSQVQLAYIDSYITYRLSVADLNRKTMYDFEHNRSFLPEKG